MDRQFENIKLTHKSHGILQITLANPEKLNSLSGVMFDELEEVFFTARDSDVIKGILLTGEGKAFCAGADITRLANIKNAEDGFEFAEQGQYIFRQLEELGKPSLAAINGFAFGGGCELAMATTLRIASDNAKFGQPEVKLGVIPGYGGTQRLARLVGKGRALDLCLTGRFIDAQEALQWGLISEVTSPENLITRAEEILTTILTMAPLAVRHVMQVIDYGYDLSLTEALHLEATHFGMVCNTRDKEEGIAAFLEKRPPHFIGE